MAAGCGTNLPLQFGEVDVDVCGTCLLNMNDKENGSQNGDTRRGSFCTGGVVLLDVSR